MTSKIVVNNIEADSGINTVTFNSNISGNLIGNVTGNVNSTGVTTVTSLRIGTGTSISSPATNVLTLGTNNTEAVRINPGGKVGIATTNPARKFSVVDDTVFSAGFLDVSDFIVPNMANGTSASINFGKSSSTNNLAKVVYNHTSNASSNNYLGLGFFDNDNILNITAGSNVGLGTTTFLANGKNIKIADSTISRLILDKTGSSARSYSIGNDGDFNIYDETAGAERFNISPTGVFFKGGNQVYPILQVVSANIPAGAVDLGATQTSYTDIKTFATFTPKKSGSLVYVMLQVQTWWGSSTNGNSCDVYVRLQQNSSGSYSTFYENVRIAGNFLYDKAYTHDTKHIIGTFTTSGTSSTSLKLQALYSANNTTAFNFFHSDPGNSYLIIEFDVA